MVTLPIEMPRNCGACLFSEMNADFVWYCVLKRKSIKNVNERLADCPLQDNKSHWKTEYSVKGRKATYTCASCGTAYEVMLVSSNEIKDYADKFCRECGKEMTCAVRTIEPKKEV